jgi:hypothetical protein
MDNSQAMMGTGGSGKPISKPSTTDADRLKAEILPEAKRHVAKMPRADRAASATISDSQAIVLDMANWYRERWDDLFKASYLPYPEARSFYAAAIERRRREQTNHPLALLSGIAPGVARVQEQSAEVDRRPDCIAR